jgi:diaminopimelate epimerase
MKLHFYKYQGTGNDFILLDNRKLGLKFDNLQLVAGLCDRRFGIGADGLMLLQECAGYDFEMRYFNSDGRPGSMCGNGGRCIVAFASHLGIIGNTTNFLAVDGPHYAKISAPNQLVSLQMIDVSAIEKSGDAYILNTGSPHYVAPVKELTSRDVFSEGRAIRYSDRFNEQGINVNFVEDLGDRYFVRTYERGVEDETYACGTGVTAVALAMASLKGQEGELESPVKVLGGELNIRFTKQGDSFSDIFLEGPAKLVFEGDIEVSDH